MCELEAAQLITDPYNEAIRLSAELALAKMELARLQSDKDSLPEGWNCTQISENRIRINALSTTGDQCYWILDTEGNT